MTGLTLKQQATLDVISRVYLATGVGPTVRQVAAEFGINTCSAQRRIEALVAKGYVAKDRYKYRSIRPTGIESPLTELDRLRAENARLRRLLGEAA